MVDSSKRRSLKSLGGMMAMPLVPVVMIPTTIQANAADAGKTVNAISSNEELSISLVLGDEPVMRVTNNSDSLTILRSIHPGVVHAGATTYDLNYSLNGSAYAIGAGKSRIIPITEAVSTMTEQAVNRRTPLKLATISADNSYGRILNSSRAFFA